MNDPRKQLGTTFIQAVLCSMNDGFQFEDLGQKIYQILQGVKFRPVGGIHDGGIDAFVNFGLAEDDIYQFSIQEGWKGKVSLTAERVRKTLGLSEKDYLKLTYVTSQNVELDPLYQKEMVDRKRVVLNVIGAKSLAYLIDSQFETRSAFCQFCEEHAIFEVVRQETVRVFGSKASDKLLIFVKHLLEDTHSYDIVESVVKTELLLSLRDTDPDLGKFRTYPEILEDVNTALPTWHAGKIDLHLKNILHKIESKPQDLREVRVHAKDGGFCLAYDMRKRLSEWEAADVLLSENFKKSFSKRLVGPLQPPRAELTPVLSELGVSCVAAIFRRQGLDLLQILSKKRGHVATIDFKQIAGEVVRGSTIEAKHQPKVCLLLEQVIRDLIWRPTAAERNYLVAVARTYSLMFVSKADDQVASYLRATAQGTIFILGTDLVIKVLAETHLPNEFKRHTQLITSLKAAGVEICVTSTILEEADHHIRSTLIWYQEHVQPFLAAAKDGATKELVEYLEANSPKILVRAFHYAKQDGKAGTLHDFLSAFVTVGSTSYEREIEDYLRGEYAIEHCGVPSSNAPELNKLIGLMESVLKTPRSRSRYERQKIAEMDAKTVHAVYELRKTKRPPRTAHIFRELVWWLTKEEKPEKLQRQLREIYHEMPNMTPECALAVFAAVPHFGNIREAYDRVLASGLGLNLSHFVDERVCENLAISMEAVQELGAGKKEQLMGKLAETLRLGRLDQARERLVPFFDEKTLQNANLNRYATILKASGKKRLWKEILKDHTAALVQLQYFTAVTGFGKIQAVRYLKTEGFSEDVKNISTSALIALETL